MTRAKIAIVTWRRVGLRRKVMGFLMLLCDSNAPRLRDHRPMHEDGELGTADDLVGDTANQESRQAATSMRFDGDHVDRRRGVIEDRYAGLLVRSDTGLHRGSLSPQSQGFSD